MRLWPHVLFLLVLSGCATGRLPTIAVRSADVSEASLGGLGMIVHLTANNPNAFDVTLRAMHVRVTVAGQDLGTADIAQTWTLPAGQDVTLDANVTVPWGDVPSLLMTIASSDQVPYRLDGTADVEQAGSEVEFAYQGAVPRAVFLQAAQRSIPILPGLVQIQIQ